MRSFQNLALQLCQSYLDLIRRLRREIIGPGLDTKKQISLGSNLISSAESLGPAVPESLLRTWTVLRLCFLSKHSEYQDQSQ